MARLDRLGLAARGSANRLGARPPLPQRHVKHGVGDGLSGIEVGFIRAIGDIIEIATMTSVVVAHPRSADAWA